MTPVLIFIKLHIFRKISIEKYCFKTNVYYLDYYFSYTVPPSVET